MITLPDLAALISKTKAEQSKIDLKQSVSLASLSWEKIIGILDKNSSNKTSFYQAGDHTLVVKNKDNQLAYISAEELPSLLLLAGYLKALKAYGDAADLVAKEMGFKSRKDDAAGHIFGVLPSLNLDADIAPQTLAELKKAIGTLSGEANASRFERFISDPEWGGMLNSSGSVGKKLDRNDWTDSPTQFLGNMIAAASAYRTKLIEALVEADISVGDLQVVQGFAEVTFAAETDVKNDISGENRLYFGAPGTGKSSMVSRRIVGKEVIRTVFHSDMQNSDFVGALKPKMVFGPDGKLSKVSYGFSPGPFANALSKSLLTPEVEVFLVIEELNRAPAAAVFGDLFLLLDRKNTGESEYSVDFPSEEFHAWLQTQTTLTSDKLSLPANLSILATMNSADQGVFPIDSAFRRRWRHTYLPINFDDAPKGPIEVVRTGTAVSEIEWAIFGEKLNERLSSKLEITEDRLLGAWFVSPEELKASSKTPEKLLTYLWDDLLRHGGKGDVFDVVNIATYGELSRRVEANEQIFTNDFLREIGIEG
jgi:hypothetical protein